MSKPELKHSNSMQRENYVNSLDPEVVNVYTKGLLDSLALNVTNTNRSTVYGKMPDRTKITVAPWDISKVKKVGKILIDKTLPSYIPPNAELKDAEKYVEIVKTDLVSMEIFYPTTMSNSELQIMADVVSQPKYTQFLIIDKDYSSLRTRWKKTSILPTRLPVSGTARMIEASKKFNRSVKRGVKDTTKMRLFKEYDDATSDKECEELFD
jgi:hypothetical protein